MRDPDFWIGSVCEGLVTLSATLHEARPDCCFFVATRVLSIGLSAHPYFLNDVAVAKSLAMLGFPWQH